MPTFGRTRIIITVVGTGARDKCFHYFEFSKTFLVFFFNLIGKWRNLFLFFSSLYNYTQTERKRRTCYLLGLLKCKFS